MLGFIQESCRLTGLAQAEGVLGYWPLEYKQNPKLLRFLSVITKYITVLLSHTGKL